MATRNLCKIKRPLGPPCPAPCNPCSPKVQLENDFARVNIQIRETENNYTAKLTECVALRAEVLEKMDEISSNRDQLAEVLDRVRQLEMKLEGFSQNAGVFRWIPSGKSYFNDFASMFINSIKLNNPNE